MPRCSSASSTATARTTARPRSSCARPSGWRKSSARSARSPATRPSPTWGARKSWTSDARRARIASRRCRPSRSPRGNPKRRRRSSVSHRATRGTRAAARERPARERPSRPRTARAIAAPSPEQILAAVFRLGRELRIEMSEEELIHRFVRCAADLLPGRSFCVRLVDPESIELSLVYATGRLVAGKQGPLTVSRAAAEAAEIPGGIAGRAGLAVSERYVPLFDRQAQGFDALLVHGEHVYGLVNVEYPTGVETVPDDRAALQPLAEQLSGALR